MEWHEQLLVSVFEGEFLGTFTSQMPFQNPSLDHGLDAGKTPLNVDEQNRTCYQFTISILLRRWLSRWSGRWESNPRIKLGKLVFYH